MDLIIIHKLEVFW